LTLSVPDEGHSRNALGDYILYLRCYYGSNIQ
jgi:hypothetical protein